MDSTNDDTPDAFRPNRKGEERFATARYAKWGAIRQRRVRETEESLRLLLAGFAARLGDMGRTNQPPRLEGIRSIDGEFKRIGRTEWGVLLP